MKTVIAIHENVYVSVEALTQLTENDKLKQLIRASKLSTRFVIHCDGESYLSLAGAAVISSFLTKDETRCLMRHMERLVTSKEAMDLRKRELFVDVIREMVDEYTDRAELIDMDEFEDELESGYLKDYLEKLLKM